MMVVDAVHESKVRQSTNLMERDDSARAINSVRTRDKKKHTAQDYPCANFLFTVHFVCPEQITLYLPIAPSLYGP